MSFVPFYTARPQEYLRVNSLILKETSPVVQHFTAALAPGVHYKPILVNNANVGALAQATEVCVDRFGASALPTGTGMRGAVTMP